MARLNIDRQNTLEPKRIQYAKEQIEKLGYKVVQLGNTQLIFKYGGCYVHFFPYSGWHSGASIKDGRGLENLLKQIKPKNNL